MEEEIVTTVKMTRTRRRKKKRLGWKINPKKTGKKMEIPRKNLISTTASSIAILRLVEIQMCLRLYITPTMRLILSSTGYRDKFEGLIS
jgi:hypothetical protein